MKNKVVKITAITLCIALLAGVTGKAAYALTNNHTETEEESQTENTGVAEEAEESKDEAVYILADANGAVQKIIVSDWIKNADGNDTYSQETIEKELPVQMSVSYTLDGKAISPEQLAGKSGHVTIRFDYENLQYEEVQVDGKKEKIYVPFTMLTGMLLDTQGFRNVEISSGKVINDGEHYIVAGVAFPGLSENLAISKEKLDIPDYVELSADVEDFEISTTMTLATTELFDDIDSDKLDMGELSDSMDELVDAMAQLMDGSSSLYDGLCTLLEKSGELVDGINQLADGANELNTGAKTLDSGAAKLQAGAKQLSDGLNTLDANSGTLNDGAKQVFDSLLSMANSQLSAAGLSVPTLSIENYEEVLNGVIASLDSEAVYQQAMETVTAKVNEQRGYIEEQVTKAVQAQVETQVAAAVTEAVRAQVETQVSEQVTAAAKEKVEQGVKAMESVFLEAVLTEMGMTAQEYEAAIEAGMISSEQQEAVNAAVASAMEAKIEEQMQSEDIQAEITATIKEYTDAQMNDEQVQAQIAALTAQKIEEQMQSEDIQAAIASNTELQVQQAIADAMNSEEVQVQLGAAAEGAKSIIALKTSLDSYNTFYLGLKTYTSGVSSAAAGAGELKSGTDALKSGTSELYGGTGKLLDGITTMKESAPALIDGVTQLRDGALKLSDGLKQFNEDGIQKLVDLVDGDLEGLSERIRLTSDAAKHYTTFSDNREKTDGNVKFIYKTDSIK